MLHGMLHHGCSPSRPSSAANMPIPHPLGRSLCAPHRHPSAVPSTHARFSCLWSLTNDTHPLLQLSSPRFSPSLDSTCCQPPVTRGGCGVRLDGSEHICRPAFVESCRTHRPQQGERPSMEPPRWAGWRRMWQLEEDAQALPRAPAGAAARSSVVQTRECALLRGGCRRRWADAEPLRCLSMALPHARTPLHHSALLHQSRVEQRRAHVGPRLAPALAVAPAVLRRRVCTFNEHEYRLRGPNRAADGPAPRWRHLPAARSVGRAVGRRHAAAGPSSCPFGAQPPTPHLYHATCKVVRVWYLTAD